MKFIMLITLIPLLLFFEDGTSIYTLSFTTIEGGQKSMIDYKEKKIVIVILPVTNTAKDSVLLKRLDSLSLSYQSKYNFIGVPAYEYGYTDATSLSLKAYYRSLLGQQVVISKGVYVKKSAGRKQSPLLLWLTDEKLNTHFDQEVKGVWQKYFINEQGDLFAVFGPEMNLHNRLIEEMNQLQGTR